MIDILRMWLMVWYFRTHEEYLHTLYGILDNQNKYNTNSVVGRSLQAFSEKNKTLVPASTLWIRFVSFYYSEYWFKNGDINSKNFFEKHQNHDKHIKFAKRVFKNCLLNNFFDFGNTDETLIYITFKGEQFSRFPIGLFREWLIYLKPFTGIGIGALATAFFYYLFGK